MNVVAVLEGGTERSAALGWTPSKALPLSLYNTPPAELLTLEDFELLAFERLKLLRAIENARTRGLKPLEFSEEVMKHHKAAFESDMRFQSMEAYKDFMRRDLVSHHILRLACCMTEEQRKWFLQHETQLFRWRAEKLDSEQLEGFVNQYNFTFTKISVEEREMYDKQLRQVERAMSSMGQGSDVDFEVEMFYKVPFQQVLELVRQRAVLLVAGMAFVPKRRLVSLFVNEFRAYLSHMLIEAHRFLPSVLRDERLEPILTTLGKGYTGPDYGSSRFSVDRVGAEDVDELSKAAFPLCMQSMHNALKETHKLKHLGRLQYGLFLKGVGLSLEDALVFWQTEFTRAMTTEEFLKKYAYNIRYNYGKEGKRADFAPYSCVRIVQSAMPSGDEVHGCPYKTWSSEQLRVHLSRMRLAHADTDSIVELSRSKDYQIACRRQFEARFPGADSSHVGSHPNAYTEAANAYLRAAASGTTSDAPAAMQNGNNSGAAVFSTASAATSSAPSASAVAPAPMTAEDEDALFASVPS